MKHQILQCAILYFFAYVRSSSFSTNILMKNTRVLIDQEIDMFAHAKSLNHSTSKYHDIEYSIPVDTHQKETSR